MNPGRRRVPATVALARVAGCLGLVAALLAGGCASAPPVVPGGRQTAAGALAGCPEPADGTEPSDAELQQLDRSAGTAALTCALARLRAASPPVGVSRALVAARLCFLLADGTAQQRQREALAREGVRWAELALASPAGQGRARYLLAVNLGLAVRQHPTEALRTLGRLVTELDAARQAVPGEDQGGPLRVLGMLYLMAPAWPAGVGDEDRALELLREAAASYPGHPQNHLFYAQALWQAEGEAARPDIRQQLDDCRLLLVGQAERWGEAGVRWQAEVGELARRAGIEQGEPRQSGGPGSSPAAGHAGPG